MRPKKVILVAMANEHELSTMRFTLETKGYRTLAAANGDEAVNLFALEPVDLVLIDFHLPPINGDSSAGRMKSLAAHIPVIMLRDKRPLGCDLFAADALLDKTRISTADLLERIAVMSARKRGPRKGSPSAFRCGMNGKGKQPAAEIPDTEAEVVA